MKRASGLMPRASARERDMTTAAAAPSEVWLELPAVTVPLAWKTGFSFWSASKEVSARGPSSWVKVLVVGLSLTFSVRCGGDDVDRDDLVGEVAGGDGVEGLCVGFERELVLFFTAYAVMFRDAFGGEAHGHVAAGVVFDQPGVDRDLVAAEGHVRHALGAAGDDDVGAAAADAIGGERDGLQAGGAVAVDRHPGSRNG